ncbi:DUF6231 family protein [Psychrobacter aquaticus]|uniref:Uncharacterized protein n=1 Tax=Psychrobacter aquaticus CMS 56 TaxID=1354303 RepID=U4T369_9GAMM|nr:DUF6231 family protein [Psychrobacter aquaticus]ERL54451.1 hypothetical protein M917_2599 [Psychrobacter aquaticus CMS 56]
MTKHIASRSDITLPLLRDYVDALLPSLANGNAEVLWIVQDNSACAALRAQLKSHIPNTDNDAAVNATRKLQVSTLSELTQQQTSKRYELTCFWLPTLSSEQLQKCIPLLMRYRDLYAAHLLIALDSTIDLKAYGFTPFDILNEHALKTDDSNQTILPSSLTSSVSTTLWQFNLYDYKQLPNWLNADYWANPENWGKHRW